MRFADFVPHKGNRSAGSYRSQKRGYEALASREEQPSPTLSNAKRARTASNTRALFKTPRPSKTVTVIPADDSGSDELSKKESWEDEVLKVHDLVYRNHAAVVEWERSGYVLHASFCLLSLLMHVQL